MTETRQNASEEKPAPENEASKPPSPLDEEDPLPGGWIRENLEAIVVAVIMALVIRHFCVEAFKIPTSSMEPTLFGNHPSEKIQGDRILVNKFVYQFSDPDRWDVIVFKYPLDRTKNYIKRLIGLPGEGIRIWGGNIYVNPEPEGSAPKWKIARKPPRVQGAIWQEIYPRSEGEGDEGSWGAAAGTDFRRSATGGSLRALQGGEARISYQGRIRSRADPHGSRRERHPTGEIRLDFDAVLERGTILVDLDLVETNIRVRIPVGEGMGALWVDGSRVAQGPCRLVPGKRTPVSFVNVDGLLSLEVNGRTVTRHEYDPGITYSEINRPRLHLGLTGGGTLTLTDLTLYRDIHYVEDSRGVLGSRGGGGEGLRIPAGCYFVLGDNCTSSKDSRLWKRIRFQLRDGREIEGEYTTGVKNGADGEIHLLDSSGYQWHLSRREVMDFDVEPAFAPFVPRENLIGQAFMVFWPLPRMHLID